MSEEKPIEQVAYENCGTLIPWSQLSLTEKECNKKGAESAISEFLRRNGEPVGHFQLHKYGPGNQIIEQVVDKAKHEEGVFPLFAAPQPLPWRCYHCGETFAEEESAALHFGTKQEQMPICTLDAAYLRDLESRLEQYRYEDTDLHKELSKTKSDNHLALQRAEEAGYAKGLKDATPQPLPSVEELAGFLSVFPPHNEEHPENCLPMAKAVLELLKGER